MGDCEGGWESNVIDLEMGPVNLIPPGCSKAEAFGGIHSDVRIKN